jgi:formylglycine-generating enzyme required for sulfatase activity
MKMVFVPAGEFIMGGHVYYHENPIHLVRLNAFWIDQTEVTNAMFAAFLNAHSNLLGDRITALDTKDEDAHIHLVDGSWQAIQAYEAHPVVEVTWYGAVAYCSWAGRRLPTEAEWEKAARGTNEHIYPWGNDEPTADMLNFNDVIGDTTKVGSYATGASPYDVFDMAGNVWEWTADWYAPTYYVNSPSVNPLGPDSGLFRVLRGGAWNDRDTYARSSHRSVADPIVSHDFLGFRCARSQ